MKTKSICELPLSQKIFLAILFFVLGTIIFLVVPTPSVDWYNTFYPVSRLPLSPYSIKTFVNVPWTALILYPLHYLPANVGCAVNASLNMTIIGALIVKKRGNVWALVLTLTSFPFMFLLKTGSVEWIPALGFLLQNQYGVPLLLTKPQSGIFSALAWIEPGKKRLFILPLILVVAFSFLIWGNWLKAIWANIQYMSDAKIGLFTVDISPFPWGIPLGLGLIYYILKYRPRNSELLGTLSTFFLVPYFVPHSLTILFALLSASYRRIAVVCWFLLWLYPLLLIVRTVV